jgi:hypothetical protein
VVDVIREMKEEHLQAASSAEVKGMVREYGDYVCVKADEVAKAAAVVDRIRKMPPGVRAAISTYLGSGELWCKQCGRTSCVHGYPDI